MADIKQAAKWMLEGKRVRQPGSMPAHEEKRKKEAWYGYIVDVNGELFVMKTRHLLAADWEIAE